jgi:hypothetical protein
MEHQQNIEGRSISVILVRARSNRFTDIAPRAEACFTAMGEIGPGQIVRVG